MGTDTGLYKFVLLLHILSVVVGIGATMLNGVYGAKAKAAGGPAAGAIATANFEVTMIAEKVIYTIPIWGILLVVMSDDAWSMSQFWIWASLVLFVVALGIAHGVMVPTTKKLLAIGGSDPAQAEACGKKLAAGGMTLNLLIVALIALMIWKPGV